MNVKIEEYIKFLEGKLDFHKEYLNDEKYINNSNIKFLNMGRIEVLTVVIKSLKEINVSKV